MRYIILRLLILLSPYDPSRYM